MTAPRGPGVTKDDLREWSRTVRPDIAWEDVSSGIVAGLRAWAPLGLAGTVLVFLPLADEVNLQPLHDSLQGKRIVATRTPDRGGSLTIHELGGPLEVHRFGFLQPHAQAPAVETGEVDAFLVPGVAFDLWGNRLGRGAGYFDGLLAGARTGALLVGVTPAALVVDHLPVESRDVAVRHLATEEGVIECAS